MQRFIWICVAGAAGTAVRHGVQTWAARAIGASFPYGTLLVNLAGSFFICLVMQLASKSLVSPDLRAVLATGFLGGLTTYSAFNYDTVHLLDDQSFTLAFANLSLTLFGCGLLGFLGLYVGRLLTAS
jgi:CrcB protein